MRKIIWISCVTILFLCLLLLLFKGGRGPQTTTMIEQDVPLTNQTTSPPKHQMPSSREIPNVSSSNSATVGATRSQPSFLELSNAHYQQVLSQWQAPIEFYGKVVDENTNAVAGAHIQFGWTETPFEDGYKNATTESDSNGLFSLQEKLGASLRVEVVKDGYFAYGRGQKGFSYAVSDHFSPDLHNPVIFRLRKKGDAASLLAMKRNYRIPRDGTPVSIDLATGARTAEGNLVVRCWTSDQGKRSGEKYDWRCVVSIPGGGAVATDEEFPFLAPETGYKPTVEINMPADQPGWKSDVDLRLYYRLANGRYGRMTFSMIAGGQHFCMIDSVLNPSGSRNLESDPKQFAN